jgi:hypothetical protein
MAGSIYFSRFADGVFLGELVIEDRFGFKVAIWVFLEDAGRADLFDFFLLDELISTSHAADFMNFHGFIIFATFGLNDLLPGFLLLLEFIFLLVLVDGDRLLRIYVLVAVWVLVLHFLYHEFSVAVDGAVLFDQSDFVEDVEIGSGRFFCVLPPVFGLGFGKDFGWVFKMGGGVGVVGFLVHVYAVEVLGLVGFFFLRMKFALALAFDAVVVVVLIGGFHGFAAANLFGGGAWEEGVGLSDLTALFTRVQLRNISLFEAK